MCAIGAAKVMPTEVKAKIFDHESKKLKDEEHSDLKDVFIKSFEAVDAALAGFDFEGCTATVVMVWEALGYRWVQCANVGDSSAYLKHGDQVIKISRDHNPKDLLEKERLKLMGVQLTEGKTRIAGLAVKKRLRKN
jgi:protein phosphatase